ncbi:serine protease [Streptomyces sp. NPDC046805]|uniref:S1 family peptidase n=1 Tax=Streptomyces sp. NPDC046805 TaxID=3155134 RepID=UPI0033D3D4FD
MSPLGASPLVGAQPSRAVLTIAQGRSSGGTWLAGSGFLVRPKCVVTTSHNLGDGDVTVRTTAGAEHQAAVVYDGRSDGLDLAVLRASDDLEVSDTVGFARVNRATPVLLDHCWAVGFPRFMQRRNIFGRRLRDTVQVTGVIAPASRAVSGLLRLQVTDTPSGVREGSQWQGLSGAVVFASDRHYGDLAVGLVVEHGLDEGPSALTVLPFTAIDDLDQEQRTRVWELLGASMDALPVLPRTQDQQDTRTLLGASTLLNALSVRRAYSCGDRRLLAEAAQGMTDQLAQLDAGRAMSVAFSLSESARELQGALATFGTTPPGALRRAVHRLIVLNKDYAEDFGEPRGMYSYFPTIGRGHDFPTADPAPFGIPADDSFAAFHKLAIHLATSCVRLVAVREAALELITAITDAHPTLRTHGEDTAIDIFIGISELQQVQRTLVRTAALVGLVIGQSDTETRRATLRILAKRETGDIARLLSALATVESPRAWHVTPAPDGP